MAAYQTLLLPQAIYQAGKDRKCYHDSKHHKIKLHEVVLQLQVSQYATKGFCVLCATEMIAQAKYLLEFMEKQLADPAPDEESYHARLAKYRRTQK